MGDVLWRVCWFVAVAATVAYASYLFFGSIIKAEADQALSTITARDVIARGEHSLSGMVMVPSDCHGLSLRVRHASGNDYILDFSTWEEPYRDCPQEPTPRAFHATTFASSIGTSFSAYLDGAPVPLVVIPYYP